MEKNRGINLESHWKTAHFSNFVLQFFLEGNRDGKKETILIWGHCLDFFRTLDWFSSNREVR